MDDQQLEEKFRETTLHLERVEGELKILRAGIINVESKVERLRDELTLPSGRMNQRFSDLEKQIRRLGEKPSS
jgi:hypothetical protein